MQTTLSLFAAGSLLFAGTAVAAHYGNGQPAPLPGTGTIVVPPIDVEPVAGPFERRIDRAGVQLRLRCDRSTIDAADGIARMQVHISSLDDTVLAERRPCDVIVVLDRSGSMGGDKMAWAKRALHELVGELGSDDRFSLLSFSGGMQQHIAFTDERERDTWAGIIDGISPGGGTNMGSALQPALALAEQSRAAGRDARVIVLSDGEVNEGLDAHSLVVETRRAVVGEFVVSSVGVGTGFNEEFMQQLSDAGTGNYHFIKSANDLGEIFVGEFEAARQQVARALRLVLDLPQGVSIAEAAGYPVDRSGSHASIALGGLRAGRERSFWLTLRADCADADTVSLPAASLHFVRDELPFSIAIDERPQLAVTHDKATALAGLDKERWEQGVVDEAFNQLRAKVAKAVRDGDKEAAQLQIQAYQQQYQQANDVVGSAAVDATLVQSREMAEELEACFDDSAPAAVQAERQNIYSKMNHAGSISGRRSK